MKKQKCNFRPVVIEGEKDNVESTLHFGNKPFKQYSRLTVVLDNANQVHSLVSFQKKFRFRIEIH